MLHLTTQTKGLLPPLFSFVAGMYGSYLLDKNRWPLVFDCVRAMTTALKDKNNSCDVNKRRNKIYGNEEKHDGKKVEGNSGDCDNGILDEKKKREEKEEEDIVGIPLLCKIRISEDGVDSYKATEEFCRGTVSYRAVRYGLLHILRFPYVYNL